MTYQLVALDLDGTLLEADDTIRPETIDAIAAAESAGLAVCLATGRSAVETIPLWRRLRLRQPYQPLVVVGGALVSEPDTGRTLYHRPIDRALACRFADALAEDGYAPMALLDGWRGGVDYLLVERGDVQAAERGWFDKMNVRIRRVAGLADAPELPPPLRVTAVVPEDRAEQVAAELAGRFAERLNVHAICAPNYGVTIVEAFAAGADKFTGLQYVAQAQRIPASRIVAVGDDVNDLPMIRRAGLGVAMAHATDELRRQADLILTGTLAEFLHDLARRKSAEKGVRNLFRPLA